MALLAVRSALAQGFTPLNFPPESQIAQDQVIRWDFYDRDEPLVLTYAIADDFLADSGIPHAELRLVIESALARWSDASHGYIIFEESPYPAVLTQGNVPGNFLGPSFDAWFAQFLDCDGDVDCINALDPPGWGAHIDFISLPVDYPPYTIGNSGGQLWGPTECNLGYTAFYRDSRLLRSTDVILNEKWDWTTNAAEAVARAGEQPEHPIGCGCRAHNPERTTEPYANGAPSESPDDEAEARSGCAGLQLTVDLETVLVHEIGHALGLDHPNEAAQNNSAIICPWVFVPSPSGSANPEAIMYGGYMGMKRELTPDDIGGLAFLYRPRWGDVDADGSITIADWFNAYEFVLDPEQNDPYAVNLLDFGQRNGVIEFDELSILTGWLGGEVPYPHIVSTFATVPPGLSEITVRLEPRPVDIGLGAPLAIDVYIENPQGRQVRGFDIEIVFDGDLFTDPVVVYADLIPDALSIPPMQMDCHLRFGQIATFTIPQSLEGLAATILFDFDLPDAVAIQTYQFDVESAIIPVTDPVIHNFGVNPNYPGETLLFVPAVGFANDYDVNDSMVIDTEDLYSFDQDPVGFDVDQNGVIDEVDRDKLVGALRNEEQDDALLKNK